MVLRVTYLKGLFIFSILQSDKDHIKNVIKDVIDKWSQSDVDYFNV